MNRLTHLYLNPKRLFLIDSIGALITAFFLFVIMRNFGMPNPVLTHLSIAAVGLSVYSLACFFILRGNWSPFLMALGIANLLYCSWTTILIILHFDLLTGFNFIYFFGEIVLISGLVYLEFKAASLLKKQ